MRGHGCRRDLLFEVSYSGQVCCWKIFYARLEQYTSGVVMSKVKKAEEAKKKKVYYQKKEKKAKEVKK